MSNFTHTRFTFICHKPVQSYKSETKYIVSNMFNIGQIITS